MSQPRRRFEPTEAGRHLSGRPTTNTRPERLLRQALHREGFRFRLHVRLDRACNPDLVLPRHRLAVWVDGCFWHGHDHVRPVDRGPNVELWSEKIATNRARDASANRTAESLGFVAVRVWECEIRQDLRGVIERMRRASLAERDHPGPS